MKWYIQISGKDECLEWLLKTLKDQDPSVIKEDDGTYGLYSSSLDDLEEAEARVKAETLIKNLNVICGIKSACSEGLDFSTLYYFDEGGHKHAFVYLSATINATGSCSGTLSGREGIDLKAEKMKKYLPLLFSDDKSIAEVFLFYNLDNQSAFGLWKIYEAIRKDFKAKGYRDPSDPNLNERYCKESELKSFTNSINSHEGVGPEIARHIDKIMSPKLKKMNIMEARIFLDNLFWKWLDAKAENRI